MNMEKEKAIKEAEAFKEDWELDRWEGLAYNKPTGLMISLGSVWRDKDGHRQFQVIHWYKDEVPGAQRTAAEVNRLLKEFGILYEAGYMPPLTKEERAIKDRLIDKGVEESRKWHQAEVARQQEWIRTHPKEYEEWVKKNRENARKRKIQWFLDHELPIPDSLKNNER